ncbi:MAG: hypothetical protein VXY17_01250 [Verrucomicrobiota bacterium]|nr:hypothetical protein [Verrucomicrobiota bacterium]
MIDNFITMHVMDVPIAPVIIGPETEEQSESRSQIKQEKNIHI